MIALIVGNEKDMQSILLNSVLEDMKSVTIFGFESDKLVVNLKSLSLAGNDLFAPLVLFFIFLDRLGNEEGMQNNFCGRRDYE